MNRIYVFDIDGTLTPARQRMTDEFASFFLEFSKENGVYLVTGSDYDKVIEQVPADILSIVKGVFTCSGNQYWEHDCLIHENAFSAPEKLLSYLNDRIEYSAYHTKTGRHIEVRPGMINFSTVGRNCTIEQRKQYYYWDRQVGERKHMRDRIKYMFPELDCVIGGEISVDIYPMGCDKSQAILFIKDNNKGCPISFFGDKLARGGNDYSVLSALNGEDREPYDTAKNVDCWRDTMRNLQEFQENVRAR